MTFIQRVIVGLIALIASGPAWGQIEPIVTTDLLKIRTVSSIDVTDDGMKAVFAVRSIVQDTPQDDEEAGYSYRSHLYWMNLFDIEAPVVQLTHGDRNDSSPTLSPDGTHIAFVRAAEEGDDAQVWVLPLAGGEARQVTTLEHGASRPVWSPDGLRLLVSSTIPMSEIEGSPPWPMERPRRDWSDSELGDDQAARPDGTKEEIRAWLRENADEENPTLINRIAFQGEQGLRGEMQFTHLFLVDPNDAGEEPKRITDGFINHDSPAFLPSGDSLVYTTSRSDDVHPDRLMESTIWKINIDGTEDRELVVLDGWTLRSPRLSRDGSVVAFIARKIDQPADRQSRLCVASIVDSPVELFWFTDEETYDFSVGRFEWTGDKIELVFTSARHGGFPLMKINEGLLIEPVSVVERDELGPVGVQAFAAGGNTIVYAVTSPANPCTVRVIDARGDRLALDLNEWVRDKKLSMPREGWIDRPDGTRVQYWTMEPTNRESGQTYPVCLEIHGGPSAMWGPGEFTMWHEFQLLCSWGYAVVYANPRGSGGYGYEFQRANFQDWGDGPTGDVLAALDRAIADNDWMDRDRLVVTGGSYAGYLTAWIVGHDHRFKAAVAQRGVYDLKTFFGEGNAWRLANWAMGGYPWEARMRTIYRRESPFTDVNKIRTPLLIMHASQDLRTGVSQSEMLYRALKELKRPVEYIRYPNAGHDLSRRGDPTQRLDRLNRILEFFDRHIDNPRPAPLVSESTEE